MHKQNKIKENTQFMGLKTIKEAKVNRSLNEASAHALTQREAERRFQVPVEVVKPRPFLTQHNAVDPSQLTSNSLNQLVFKLRFFLRLEIKNT